MVTRAILLAAGSGSRFGGGKLLARLPDGTPIGLASWRNLSAALPDNVAVVRAGDTQLRELLESNGATVIECSDADAGMSRSLIAGLQATQESDAWVVALGDMPYIKPATIRKVAAALDEGDLIVQPFYEGKPGHPVGFSGRLRDELMNIRGDEGAREVVKRHSDQRRRIVCDDAGILRDIDTQKDLGGN